MNYNKLIDHTLLKPDCSSADIEKLCDEAKAYKFKSVCINPGFVQLCHNLLRGYDVEVCTVIGFPLGATSTASKGFETQQAIKDGADEIDMVINISRLKEGDFDYVLNDIKEVVKNAYGHLVKVIIETCLLSDGEKVKACQLAVQAGANFVKTSTGFSTGGATIHDVELMRRTVGPNIGVKASGGVRTKEDLLNFVKAGATRIGTSSGPKLVDLPPKQSKK
ncbi:MAG: deoxyribose-phosphate aldolase [Bacilli bacterium]|nr:deoxyribose-phosphate aldolase [Bacilli bacterium]MDD3422309.1 deoxyribose-phosphate aldolase [Bacilli bacterium]MDD4065368.1 deoxyribose-phosphate aldolase [Bacilli bacterium]